MKASIWFFLRLLACRMLNWHRWKVGVSRKHRVCSVCYRVQFNLNHPLDAGDHWSDQL